MSDSEIRHAMQLIGIEVERANRRWSARRGYHGHLTMDQIGHIAGS
jgi:hypothetical protein